MVQLPLALGCHLAPQRAQGGRGARGAQTSFHLGGGEMDRSKILGVCKPFPDRNVQCSGIEIADSVPLPYISSYTAHGLTA